MNPSKRDASKEQEATPPVVLDAVSNAFPIVGIGASAGGLVAFEAFFSAMPATTDSGMSLVLVQHLAPDHKSMLCELIRRYTRMEVFEVEDGVRMRPNCVYIIPPDRDMALLGGTLQLLQPTAQRGLRTPIDYFFRSLAQDQRARAICIVLSGTGSDGAQGVRAVKGEGGLVIAQDPGSTSYDGMPRSAIATGCVDYVLPPAAMPEQLISYLVHPPGKRTGDLSARTAEQEGELKKIFVLLRDHTGHDFSQYKDNTTTRRVERRLAVHRIDRVDSYLRFLQHNPDEVEALFHDLLIGVTSFFRDQTAWKTLEDQAIPQLFAGKTADTPVRVWVPGCSTGEEAYSIAILLQERMEILKRTFKCQVFATDIDCRAIAQARRGVYSTSAVADLSPERRARFFAAESAGGGAFRALNSIRDLLVFSEHDVIRDPPFSRLDLISCRNLMIYMAAPLQKKLVPLFHYALSPGGYLFLGTSESIGEFPDLFTALDRKDKLFKRKDAPFFSSGRTGDELTGAVAGRPDSGPRRVSRPPRVEKRTPLREVTEQALLQQHAQVAALIDARGEVLYLHGRTGRYLEPAPGAAGINILKMAREGLRYQLTASLRRAVANKQPVHRNGLQVKTDGGFTSVDLTVWPVAAGPDAAGEPGLYLVIFEDAPVADRPPPAAASRKVRSSSEPAPKADARIAALKHELRAKDEYLEATNEELQTTNEELQSSNEELQSVNEEFQSTNEELETSKEELQSMNEELATVNAELQQKVADLSQANNDMSNLLAGTGVGTIFVDCQMRIQRFTPAVTQIFNLIPTDAGRPVSHLASNLVGYDHLVEDLEAVLDTLVAKEIEVQTKAGAWFSLRIRPYRTLDNVIEGAVVTLIDITELKRAREAQREAEDLRRLAVVVRDAPAAITVQDPQGHILAWNPAAERLYGFSESEALARNVRDLTPEPLWAEALAQVRRLRGSEVLQPYRTQRLRKDGRVVDVRVIATALVNNAGEAYAIATTEQEIAADGREEVEGGHQEG